MTAIFIMTPFRKVRDNLLSKIGAGACHYAVRQLSGIFSNMVFLPFPSLTANDVNYFL